MLPRTSYVDTGMILYYTYNNNLSLKYLHWMLMPVGMKFRILPRTSYVDTGMMELFAEKFSNNLHVKGSKNVVC